MFEARPKQNEAFRVFAALESRRPTFLSEELMTPFLLFWLSCFVFGTNYGAAGFGTDLPQWQIKVDPDPNDRSFWYRHSGSNLAALCSVEGLPEDADPPGIFWSKSPDSISSTGNVELKRIDKFALSLVFPNTSIEDSGIYTCTVSYLGTRKHVRVEINFFDELQLEEAQLDFPEPKEGSSVFLSCQVETISGNLITMWEKDITALTEESDRGYVFHKNGQVLQIRGYMPSDAGNYNCKVLDRRTGSMVIRRFRVGNRLEEQTQFCTKMCNAVCSSYYSPDN